MPNDLTMRGELFEAFAETTALTLAAAVAGDTNEFDPIGFDIDPSDVDQTKIPQTLEDLIEVNTFSYELSATRAAKLSIPVAGNIGGGTERRVIIKERVGSKTVRGNSGKQYKFGYAIRFCVTVNKWDAKFQATIPAISAQAELGNIQASWMMNVRGITGEKIDSILPSPKDLKVETYIEAMRAIDDLIKAVRDPTTRFRPGVAVAVADPTTLEARFSRSLAEGFALTSVARGLSRGGAEADLGWADPIGGQAIADVYERLDIGPVDEPSKPTRERAKVLLKGLKVAD
jgi:hypothetical protein